MPRNQAQNRSRASSSSKPGSRPQLFWRAPTIFGIRPVFTATNDWNTPPLTFRQKFNVFAGEIASPWAGIEVLAEAGMGQIDNSPAYGEEAGGYFKRVAATYGDKADDDFWIDLALPQLLHEDPRYFRLGRGSGPVHRFLWAAVAPVWARRDNKTWGLNYAHIFGDVIGSAVSNAYYPPTDRGASQTFSRAFISVGEGGIITELAEFWPQIVCHVDWRKIARAQCKSRRSRSNAHRRRHQHH